MQSAAQLHSLPYTRPAGEFSVPLKMALRTVTLVMLLVMGSMWVVGLPHLYEGTTTPCEPDCTSNQLRSEDIAALEEGNLSAEFYGGVMVFLEFMVFIPYTLCCLLMLRNLSDNWAAWVASLIFAGSSVIVFGFDYGTGQFGHLGDLVNIVFSALFGAAMLAFVYLFPSGRFHPRWAKWPVILLMVFQSWALHDYYLYGLRRELVLLSTFVMVGFYILGLVMQVVRYRRSGSTVERLQFRWVGFGIFMMAFGLLTYLLAVEVWANQPGAPRGTIQLIASPIMFLCTIPLPVTITVAILRYRLWNIDLIINRTLVYGVLTALIVGIYVAVVGGLGALFRAAGGQLFALVATGLVAISFQTLRERVQRAVNRLMFGQRDEPQAVLSQLGQRLQSAELPEDLLATTVGIITRALKFPYAAISSQRGTAATWQVAQGERKTPTEAFPLVYQNEEVGQLLVARRSPNEPLSPADRAILLSIARQMGAVVYTVRLQAELQQARERLVITREEERRRLRRDLHDGLGPALASQTLKLDTAIDLFESHIPQVRQLLHEVRGQSDELIADIRRLVHDLRPPALDELGLAGALQTALARLNAGPNGTAITFSAPDTHLEVPAAVEAAAYRIIMEAVTNVLKHARAEHCTVEIALQRGPSAHLHITVEDDGIGVPVPVTSGVGLQSMRERAEELGGAFRVEARAAGGTRLRAHLPITITEEPT